VEKLDVSKFYECIKAREGGAGRNTTDPRLLVSLWLYACIRGIGSARELARRCAESAPCACNRSSQLAKAKPQPNHTCSQPNLVTASEDDSFVSCLTRIGNGKANTGPSTRFGRNDDALPMCFG
jgi:hypothetical protein